MVMKPKHCGVIGVREETLAQHGAVSRHSGRNGDRGAEGRSRRFAVAISGIAGPDGGK